MATTQLQLGVQARDGELVRKRGVPVAQAAKHAAHIMSKSRARLKNDALREMPSRPY